MGAEGLGDLLTGPGGGDAGRQVGGGDRDPEHAAGSPQAGDAAVAEHHAVQAGNRGRGGEQTADPSEPTRDGEHRQRGGREHYDYEQDDFPEQLDPVLRSPCTRAGQIAENLRDGQLSPPVILLGEPGLANLIVIQGHKRLTGLLLCPQWLPAELEVLLGITARHRK